MEWNLRHETFFVAAGIAAGVIAASSAQAAPLTNAVNVDLNKNAGDVYVGTGLASDTGTKWNSLVYGAAVSNLVDSQNIASGVNMTISAITTGTTGSSANNASNTGGSATLDAGHALLMQDYRFLRSGANGTTAPFTVVSLSVALTNVPDGDYKLYVYAAGDTIGQGAALAVDPSNVTIGGVSSASTSGASRDLTAGQGVAWNVLDATVSDPTNTGFGTITFTASNSSAVQYTAINGFQLVAAPEPASLGLAGVAVGGLLARRRRTV